MIIWKHEDPDKDTITLSDDLVMSIVQDGTVHTAILSEHAANKLVEALGEFTTAATSRAMRADRLAEAATHLRAIGGVEFAVRDLIEVADFLDGRSPR